MGIPIEVRFVTLHQFFVRGPLFLFFKLVSYILSISGLFTEQFVRKRSLTIIAQAVSGT